MVWDNRGNIWIVTNRWRLGRIDLSADTIEFWPFKAPFDGIDDESVQLGFDNRRLWISHRDGVELFDIETHRFDTPKNTVLRPFLSFLQDGMDNIWLGTGAFGLYCIPPKQSLTSYLHNPDNPNSVTAGWVNNPFEDEEGNIWFPTNNWAGDEGLNKVDPRTGVIEKFLFRDKLPQFNRLQMINAYDKGRLLFRSGNKLYGYDVNSGQVIDPGILGDSENIESLNYIYRDSDGELWICTMTGLYRQSGEKYSLYDFSQGEMGQVVSNEVVQVLESRRGGLWVQTNEGLFFLDKETDQFERHGYDPSKGPVFSSQDINSLLEDEDGYLWVGTWQGGLNRYNPETGEILYYGLEDGLPSPSVQGILEDEDNNVLWLSTFRGIARFDKEAETFTNYGNEAGAQSLYADRSSLELTSGLFVFGGSNGITVFDPANFSGDTQPPITRITGMKAGEEAVSLKAGTNTSLDYSQNNLSISYTGIHFDNPSKNQYAYKLSPVDEDWRHVGGSRSAYFYDLKPGDYTFSVRAASPNSVWSQPRTIEFKIAPPWWMTWWAYAGYAILLLTGFLMLHRFQKSRALRKERERAKDRELEHAREIEKAYSDLKAAQTQLIHAEKMASLGELTAGIAHEIKNPLNFVNNFSEVSRELLEEMKEELKKGDTREAEAIATDVIQNLDKIVHHGQRADSIVRGMLQHSRSGDGKKEPTDLSALADEYLRLAYHGLRAKDKSFNAVMETDFDEDLPEVNMVPQDIGRVLLNLITNAFHAVSERKLKEPEGYQPTVWVKTRKSKDGVELSVRDNGNGIPDNIKDKIFQPFFTTKPTGEGTGLGLSMSYDIVTKGHGGKLKVRSETGKGSEFTIIL
jgi:signal transduction histidine kinase/ligand-binding sensor domain-containing protein